MRTNLVFAGILLVVVVVLVSVNDAWSWAAVLYTAIAVGGFVLRGYVGHRKVGAGLGRRLRERGGRQSD